MMIEDIGILGMGMWHGPAVPHAQAPPTASGRAVDDPWSGTFDRDGTFRLLGLTLPAARYPRTLAAARRATRAPFRGAVRRRVLPADVPVSAAEAEAADEALRHAGTPTGRIGALLVQSTVPDSPYPTNAALLGHRLGLRATATWALDGACAGPIAHLTTAPSLIRAGVAEYVLCVQSCAFSRVNDPGVSAFLGLGDMAVAFVVGHKPGARIVTAWSADGSSHSATATAARKQGAGPERDGHAAQWRLRLTFDHTLQPAVLKTLGRRLRVVTASVLAGARWSVKDVALFVPQQSAAWVPAYLSEELDIPDGALFHTYDDYANVGPVDIAVSWYRALSEGRVHDGTRVLAATGGAGFVYAAAAVRW
ncbi:3-oxoacyl-ACP synthase III family protein [Streptomyces sp. URMC 126]|uniref:3-oxoacyl-ACP synthase III family protein n=1 Tax=Streptomyces sp. URMC 126 TaxID=3423401 RepID=UPI003F1A7229